MAYKRLGDMLLDSGYITTDQLTTALSLQKDSGMRLGETLIDAGYITEKELIDVLCMQLGIDFIDLTNVILPTDLTQTHPQEHGEEVQHGTGEGHARRGVRGHERPHELHRPGGGAHGHAAAYRAHGVHEARHRTCHHAALRQRGRRPRHRGHAHRGCQLHGHRHRCHRRALRRHHARRRGRGAERAHHPPGELHHRARRHRARLRRAPGAARGRPAGAYAHRRHACATCSPCRATCRAASSRA